MCLLPFSFRSEGKFSLLVNGRKHMRGKCVQCVKTLGKFDFPQSDCDVGFSVKSDMTCLLFVFCTLVHYTIGFFLFRRESLDFACC